MDIAGERSRPEPLAKGPAPPAEDDSGQVGLSGRVERVVKIRGLLLGIVFAATAVGFAAAMPGAMSASDVEPAQDTIELIEAGGPEAAKAKAKPSKPEKAANPDRADEPEVETDGSEDEADGHGAVVSVVAKCDVKGRWHGEAVRSIARNKDATVADAEAACEAAKAAAEDAPAPGRSGEAKAKASDRSGGKPASAGKPAHAGGPPAGKGKDKP